MLTNLFIIRQEDEINSIQFFVEISNDTVKYSPVNGVVRPEHIALALLLISPSKIIKEINNNISSKNYQIIRIEDKGDKHKKSYFIGLDETEFKIDRNNCVSVFDHPVNETIAFLEKASSGLFWFVTDGCDKEDSLLSITSTLKIESIAVVESLPVLCFYNQ